MEAVKEQIKEQTVAATVELDLEQVAQVVAALDPEAQTAFWERVAELSWQNDLRKLRAMVHERLAREGKLNQSAEEILAELRETRERIATEDYGHLLNGDPGH